LESLRSDLSTYSLVSSKETNLKTCVGLRPPLPGHTESAAFVRHTTFAVRGSYYLSKKHLAGFERKSKPPPPPPEGERTAVAIWGQIRRPSVSPVWSRVGDNFGRASANGNPKINRNPMGNRGISRADFSLESRGELWEAAS
jgi:hypothetical protein